MAIASALDQSTSLTLRREIKASAKAVFKALIDPAAIRQWFGPNEDFTVVLAEADVRVGGQYRFVLRGKDDTQHSVSGIYREIAADRRLVFTWAWADNPERESEVSIQLTEGQHGTALTLTHVRLADTATRDRHAWGWNGSLDQLTQYLVKTAR
jgi:uncharacterized protein YndB with AHSA1/START domain